MFLIWQLLAAALITPTLTSPLSKQYHPPPGICTGKCKGRLHDPSIIYREQTSTFYRFTTNDKIHIATAPHISGPWSNQGVVFPSGSTIDNLPGKMDLWAPDVFHINGTYHLYYSVSSLGSQEGDIGVATSTTLEPDSWLDHGSVGIPRNTSYNRIDGNLFQHSAESTYLLNFGSFWGQIFQVPLTNPPVKVNGDPIIQLAKNDSVRPAGLVPGSTEGSYMFQWRGFYYLFFSSGNCCNSFEEGLAPPGEEYKVMVCRSIAG